MNPGLRPSGNQTGSAPRYTQTTTLNPDQQNLLSLETRAKTNLGNTAQQTARRGTRLNKPVDPSQWTPWQTSLPQQGLRQDTGATNRAGIEKAMMDSYNRNVAPAEQAQETSLAARGLSPGSQGYAQMQRTRDDSRAEQARQAYLASGAKAARRRPPTTTSAPRKFNMNQAANSYLNNLRGARCRKPIRPALSHSTKPQR